MRTIDQVPNVDLNSPTWDYLRSGGNSPYNEAEKAEQQMQADYQKYVEESKAPKPPRKKQRYRGGAGSAS